MAIKTKASSFSAPAANGNQSVTGLGFQPTLVKIIGMGTGGNLNSVFTYVVGAASGSSPANQFSASSQSVDSTSVSNTSRLYSDRLLTRANSTGATHEASLVSFDADGFTINWTKTSSGYSFLYVAYDMPNVEVGKTTWPNTVGNFTHTGAPFQPNAIEVYPDFSTLDDTTHVDAICAYGAATASNEQFSINTLSDDNVSPTQTLRYQTSNAVISRIDATNTLIIEAKFVGFTSDGFTLNTTLAPVSTQQLPYIIYNVSKAKAGSFTQPAADQTLKVRDVGFPPDTTSFAGIQNPNFDAGQGDNRYFFGVGSATESAAYSVYDNDNETTSMVRQIGQGDYCIIQHTSSATNQPWASYASTDLEGFHLDFIYTDGVERNTFYLALQDAPAQTGLLTKGGTVITPAVNGDVAITGLGFTPKMVMFIRGGSGDNSIFCMGAATATDQWTVAHFDKDNEASAIPHKYFSLNSCVATIASTGASMQSEANLKSLDADGFTLTFTNTSTAYGYTWIAFGGDALEVAVGNASIPNTDATDFSAAGLSFQPKALQVATAWASTANVVSGNQYTTLGFATSPTDQVSLQAGSRQGTPTDTFRYVSNTKILKRGLNQGAAPDLEIDFKSFNTDGFTLTADLAPNSAQPLPYIAWGGNINVASVSVTQPVADGMQSVTGLGFKPDFTFMYSGQNTANTIDGAATNTASAMSLGFSDGVHSQAVEKRGKYNVATSETFSHEFYGIYSGGTDTTTHSGQARYANAADGFDLDWINNDGIQRELFALSMAKDLTLAEQGFTKLNSDHVSTGLVIPDLGGATATNVPLLIKAADLTASQLAGLKNDWGDLRVSTDSAGLNQLPLDIVDGGSIAWTLIPNVAVDEVIYIWGNKASAVKEVDTATYGRNAVWIDYRAVYHLNETGNNNAGGYVDSTGNGYDGTGFNSPTNSGDSPVGYGARFNGLDQYIQLPISIFPTTAQGEFTVTALAMPDDITRDNRVFNIGDSVGDDDVLTLWQDADGAGRGWAAITKVGGQNSITGIDDANASDFRWDYIATQVSPSLITTNVNGAPASSAAITNSVVGRTIDSAIIGKLENATPTYMDGDVAELRLAFETFTDDRLSIEYQNQSASGAWWIAEGVGGAGASADPAGVSTTTTLGTATATGASEHTTSGVSTTTTLGTATATGASEHTTSGVSTTTTLGTATATGASEHTTSGVSTTTTLGTATATGAGGAGASAAPTGVFTATSLGIPTITGFSEVGVTAVSSSIYLGSTVVSASASFVMSGVSSDIVVGTAGAVGIMEVAPAGAEASGFIGAVGVTLETEVYAIGVATLSHISGVNVWGLPNTSQNATWVPSAINQGGNWQENNTSQTPNWKNIGL